jgi:hypothetical protein
MLRWLFQAMIVGVGIELGKDVYSKLKGQHRKDDGAQTRRDAAAEDQAESGDDPTTSG